MKKLTDVSLALALLTIIVGCGKTAQDKKGPEAAPVLPVALELKTKPEGAVSVVQARKQVTKGEKVILFGEIGGRVEPFVAKRAAFVLADGEALTSCDKKGCGNCKTPWDYCCDGANDIKASVITIQVLDDTGNVLKTSLKGHLGLKELSKVVVVGTYDESSNADFAVINATGIYKVQ